MQAPDVALVGTIPYLRANANPSPLPLAYATSRFETGHGLIGQVANRLAGGGAFTRLFETGDQTALNSNFPGLRDFHAALTCNSFRAAMWVTDVRIYQDAQRHPVGASYRWGYLVGSTPLRPSAIFPQLPISQPQVCLSGNGRVGPNGDKPDLAQIATGGFVITFRCDFKLCEFMDLAQWLFTRHRAPWAWMQLEYGVELEPAGGGFYALQPQGSHIPNQHLYLGWQRLPALSHGMLGNAQADSEQDIVSGGGGE